jgi:gliding motility-associated-like protein
VTANGDPAPSFTQSDACNDNVTLSATPTGPYAYAWTRNGAAVTGAQQIFITLADDGATFGVSVQNTSTGCISSAEFLDDVSVVGLLTVALSNPQPCDGTDFDITATPNQTGTLQYEWFLDDELIDNQTNQILTVTNDSDGEYKVVISKTSTGTPLVVCTAEDVVQITVSPTTQGNLLDMGIICPDPANTDPATRTRLLDAGPGFRSYQWIQDGSTLAGETNQTYLASEVGVYTVELVNAYGCPSEDEITLRDECDPRVTGPNAFRPSGLNKEFSLFTFFITDEDFEIFIFNRWGEMVFYSNDRQFTWNGGYKNNAGQPVPPGTYSYLLKFKSSYRPEQGIEELRGGVVLLR